MKLKDVYLWNDNYRLQTKEIFLKCVPLGIKFVSLFFNLSKKGIGKSKSESKGSVFFTYLIFLVV